MAAPLGGMGAPHRPVLLTETMQFLEPTRGGLFVDCTLGLGGHSEAILGSSDETRVIGFDRDPDALSFAVQRLAKFGKRFQAVHADYRHIKSELTKLRESDAAGILVDLGVSSLQFDSPKRGFSFRFNAPLDMRMDPSGEENTAADLLAQLPEVEIARILFEFGEERQSRKIARWIVEKREQGEPITNTKELADLVARAVGSKKSKLHPATRTFQALRVAVNHELEGLSNFVENSIDLLQVGGRFVSISFHSLEDRIIKQELRRLSGQCQCPPRVPLCSCGARKEVQILTRRPVTPSEEEVEENPRARSAKLRAAQKIG
jgi:16S rRNA (cytosine1402-N4)-methyltransferase